MSKKYYGIKDHKIISQVGVSGFTKERMDEWCHKLGMDTWFELDDDGILVLFDRERKKEDLK